MASKADAQAKLDSAIGELKLTTVGYINNKWTTPPSGTHWFNALNDIAAAKAEIDLLVDPTIPAPTPTPTPTPTTGYKYDLVVPTLMPTQFNYSRHIICTTRAQHDTAVNNIQSGDWIECLGISFSGSITYNPQLSSPAKITYDAACRFIGVNSTQQVPSIYLPHPKNLHLYWEGGDIINPLGWQGILAHGMTYCVLDGFKIHQMGGSGIDMFTVAADGGEIAYNFVRGEVWDMSKANFSWDSHAEKGTGYDGAHLGDGSGAVSAHHNTIALYCHDIGPNAGNAAIEIGDDAQIQHDNEYYIKARNMTMPAKTQVAGNGISVWGTGQIHNEIVKILECYNCVGRAIDTNGMGGSCNGGIVVEYGRAEKCGTNPALPNPSNIFDNRYGITYQDVAVVTGVLS